MDRVVQFGNLVRDAYLCGYALGGTEDADHCEDLQRRHDAALKALEDHRLNHEVKARLEVDFRKNAFVDVAYVGDSRVWTVRVGSAQYWGRSVLLQWRFNERDELFGFVLDERACKPGVDPQQLLEVAVEARQKFEGKD